MASLKSLYDKEVIDSIVSSYSSSKGEPLEEGEEEVEVIDPFTQIDIKEFKTGKGEKLFSTIFWKPKTIPNIPIHVFKDTDWHEEARLHIPDVDDTWVWNRKALELLALSLHEGDTTLLHGFQGTGKTRLVEQWCAMVRIPFWRMSCNRETRESHFLGSPAVEYNDEGQMFIKQEPTILTDSLKYGGLFCEDEAFRHNSALVLQSLREKNNRAIILPDAPGRTSDESKLKAPVGRWWYVLTDNTCGSVDETGIFDAEVQDASTLDRIDAVIEVKYLGMPQERLILQHCCSLNLDIINGMLNLAKLVRSAFGKQTLMSTMSVRGLLSWATKTELMGSIGTGLQLGWYNKLGTDDKRVVDDMFHQVFGRKMNE